MKRQCLYPLLLGACTLQPAFADNNYAFENDTLKSYTIRLQTSTHYVSEATKRLRVRLYAISADYYRYLKTLQDQSDRSFANHLIDAGLADPIRVYSNIDGGLGIFGGCTPNRVEVDYE